MVVVSSYPPRRCGIGAYARAQVEVLRAAGEDVRVVSPPDGEGDVRVSFDAGRQFSQAARLGRQAAAVVVHFQPGLYYRPRAPVAKILTSARLLALVARWPAKTKILVHEAERPVSLLRPDYLLLRLAFRGATLQFHTESERRSLERDCRIRVRHELVAHHDSVRVRSISRREARDTLHVSADEVLLVCAGFLTPGKGFERAVEAFEKAGGGTRGRLVIIGSVRDPTASNLEYAQNLRERAERTPGVEMIERYVPDEEFDAWIAGADAVLLPYRVSWSSGVLARVRRIGTPAIVAATGGLPEQAGTDDLVFETDEQLVELLRDRLEGGGSSSAPAASVVESFDSAAAASTEAVS